MRKTLTMTTMALVASVAVAAGTAGALDTTFDGDGVAHWADADLRGAAVQGDGKVIAVGSTPDSSGNGHMAVQRRTTSGTIDTGYGSGGTASPLSGDAHSIAFDVALDGNGRALVAGTTTFDRTVAGKGKKSRTETVTAAVLARLTTSGALDTGFGSGGIVLTELDGARAIAVAVQPDGKIVVAGVSQQSTTDSSGGGGKGKKKNRSTTVSSNGIYLARYTASGSLDSGFGDSGIIQDDVTTNDDEPCSIALQSNGGIIVGVYSGPDASVRRYTSAGLDTAFGSSGSAPIAAGDRVFGPGVAVDGSNGIVVAIGRSDGSGGSQDGSVLRLGATGLLDTSFASGGTYRTGLSGDDVLNEIAVLSDGSIVAAGHRERGGSDDAYCLKLTSAGALDSSFGSAGIGDSVTSSDSNVERSYALDVTSGGDLIVVGNSITPNVAMDGFIARYCGE